jgi:hypothetical protein
MSEHGGIGGLSGADAVEITVPEPVTRGD